MSKKVSELIKELDISIQELKGYADKLGIAISSARSTVEDQAAERLTRSINMMRGTSSGSRTGGNKPKIKAITITCNIFASVIGAKKFDGKILTIVSIND